MTPEQEKKFENFLFCLLTLFVFLGGLSIGAVIYLITR